MYVLCFRMKSMMDVAWFKSHLLLIEPILNHKLSPLKVRSCFGVQRKTFLNSACTITNLMWKYLFPLTLRRICIYALSSLFSPCPFIFSIYFIFQWYVIVFKQSKLYRNAYCLISVYYFVIGMSAFHYRWILPTSRSSLSIHLIWGICF